MRFVIAALLALLAVAGRAEAAISIVVAASRTTCVAPCAVWFDATGTTGLSGSTNFYDGSSVTSSTGDFVLAAFTWNFNDPSSSWPTTIGFGVAHTFESAGTYNVTTSVKDGSGATAGPTTTTITVSAMSGTTFYAASSGSGTTCSIGSPCSLATALTHKVAGNTIAIRNGDTFSSVPQITVSGITGPVNIVGYSDPGAPSSVRPILNTVAGEWTPINVTSSSSDIRFEHLHIVPDQATTTSGAGRITVGGSSTNVLIDDMDIEGNPNMAHTSCAEDAVFTDPTIDGVYVVGSHFHNLVGYGWYGNSPIHAALIGTAIDNIFAQCHGFRFQACQESSPGVCSSDRKGYDEYVAYNTIDAPNSFTAGEFHGDNQSIVMVGNDVQDPVGISPQNTGAVEYVANVLVDGNVMHGSPGGGYNLAARHIVVRNNVINTPTDSFSSSQESQLVSGWISELWLLNNTVKFSGNFMTFSQASAGTLVVQNNIGWNTFTGGTFVSGGLATVTEDHNLTYAPSFGGWTHPSGTGDLYGNPLWVSGSPSVAVDFMLQAGSPARDAGTTVAAYADYAGVIRPQNGTFDMGAYEFVVATSGQGGCRNRPISYGGWFLLALFVLSAGALAGHLSHRKRRADDEAHVHYVDAREVAALVEHGSDSLAVMLATPCAKCGEPVLLPRRERGKQWPPS